MSGPERYLVESALGLDHDRANRRARTLGIPAGLRQALVHASVEQLLPDAWRAHAAQASASALAHWRHANRHRSHGSAARLDRRAATPLRRDDRSVADVVP